MTVYQDAGLLIDQADTAALSLRGLVDENMTELSYLNMLTTSLQASIANLDAALAAITPPPVPPVIERPVLQNPTLIKLAARGAPLVKLSDTVDYILQLPQTTARSGGVRIVGGRNILLVGGHLSTVKGERMPNVMIGDGAPGSVVHCEGLLIDGYGGGLSDAFHLQCPTRHVQLVSNRVDGLRGSYSTTHADVIQNLGCASLSVDGLTGRSHYNGVYMRRENDPLGAPVGPATFHRVNMGGYTSNPDAAPGDPKHTLRAISLGTQPIPPGDPTSPVNGLLSGSVWLSDFYADPEEAGVTLADFAWPHAGERMEASCRATIGDHGLYWPRWATPTPPPLGETTPSSAGAFGSGDAKVYGTVQQGPPPGGDYVPAALVGLNYRRAA